MTPIDIDELPALPRKIVILGATGSIGSSALEVVRKHPDLLQVVGISGRSRVGELAAIQKEFAVPHVCLAEEDVDRSDFGPCEFSFGEAGLAQLATLAEADLVLIALVGTAGLRPTLAAIQARKVVALANKEVLVMAGKFVTEAARAKGAVVLPVDSEHNALFQCVQAAHNTEKDIGQLILTASGGAFRDRPLKDFASITVSEALKHPNWDMGPKVTIDSATMANKGLELIEARWLFGLPPEKLAVTLHPQSIVHSMVEFRDGSILSQMSPPSMTFPIQHCLLYPERHAPVQPSLSFEEAFSLDFRPVSFERYPCLRLAFEAMNQGGVAETVFNAANEVAVAAFVEGRLRFDQIHQVVGTTLDAIPALEPTTLDDVLETDRQARARSREFLTQIPC